MLLVFLFCSAFHRASLILDASLRWSGLGGCVCGGGFIHVLSPALLVVLFWLAFLSVCFFLVCFLGVVHMYVTACGSVISTQS